MGFLAFIDNFIFIIPTDGLLLAGSAAVPERRKALVLWLALGSVLGGVLFVLLVEVYGHPFLEWFLPGMMKTSQWLVMERWVTRYGLGTLFLVGSLPITQHPILALTALAHFSLLEVGLILLAARLLKYTVTAWVAVKAPQLVLKIRPLRTELESLRDALRK